MSFLRLCAWSLPLVVALLIPSLSAQDKPKDPDPAKKQVTYTVLQVDKEYKVMSADEAGDYKKKALADFEKIKKAWKAEKRKAAKENTSFSKPKPRAPKITVVKEGLKDQTEAKAYVASLLEQEKRQDQPGKATGAGPQGADKP